MICHFKKNQNKDPRRDCRGSYQIKIKTMKKSQVEKTKSRVNINPSIRVRAFIFDLYAKCNSVHKIVLNDVIMYHKIGRNIAVILREGKYIKKIKTTPSDQRGFCWIADPPNDAMIEEIQLKVAEYHKQFVPIKKPVTMKQTVFDFNQPDPVDHDPSGNDDNDEISMLHRLLKKHFGIEFQKK